MKEESADLFQNDKNLKIVELKTSHRNVTLKENM